VPATSRPLGRATPKPLRLDNAYRQIPSQITIRIQILPSQWMMKRDLKTEEPRRRLLCPKSGERERFQPSAAASPAGPGSQGPDKPPRRHEASVCKASSSQAGLTYNNPLGHTSSTGRQVFITSLLTLDLSHPHFLIALRSVSPGGQANVIKKHLSRENFLDAGASFFVSWTLAQYWLFTLPGKILPLLLLLLSWRLFFLAIQKLRSWLVSRLHLYSRNIRFLGVTFSLSLGTVLTVAIPLRSSAPPSSVPELVVEATGEKNPEAKDSEVWLKILRADGSQVDPKEFILQGPWENRDGTVLSFQQQPAELRWQKPVGPAVYIHFISHPWSGIVRITWKGKQQRLDLFQSSSGEKIVEIKESLSESVFYRAFTAMSDSMTLGLLLLILFAWFFPVLRR
jgi:hypothetical protein